MDAYRGDTVASGPGVITGSGSLATSHSTSLNLSISPPLRHLYPPLSTSLDLSTSLNLSCACCLLLAVCWCPATRLTTGESPDQAFLQRHKHVPFKTWSPKTAFAYLCTCPTVARCARCLADDHDLRLGNGEWLATQNAATLRQYPDIPASARTLICVMVHQAMSTCVAFLTLGVAVRLTMVLLCVCVFVCLYLSRPLDLSLDLSFDLSLHCPALLCFNLLPLLTFCHLPLLCVSSPGGLCTHQPTGVLTGRHYTVPQPGLVQAACGEAGERNQPTHGRHSWCVVLGGGFGWEVPVPSALPCFPARPCVPLCHLCWLTSGSIRPVLQRCSSFQWHGGKHVRMGGW